MSDFTKQMLEAAAWTFLETFVATLAPSIAGATVGDWGALSGIALSAAFSGIAAALSIFKSFAIRNIGRKDSTLISGEEPVC